MKMRYENKGDKQEVRFAYNNLKLNAFKGAGNICQSCKKKGNFGSVINYECESGNVYQICVWCGNINLISKKR